MRNDLHFFDQRKTILCFWFFIYFVSIFLSLQKNIYGGLMVLKQMGDADVKPDSQTFCYLLNNCECEEDIIKVVRDLCFDKSVSDLHAILKSMGLIILDKWSNLYHIHCFGFYPSLHSLPLTSEWKFCGLVLRPLTKWCS